MILTFAQRSGFAGLAVIAGLLLAGVAESQTSAESAMSVDPGESIVIGPREKLGKESLGSKAAKNVIGSLFGGSEKSSGRSGPKTRKDPTRKIDYTIVEKKTLDLEVGARAAWNENGLLVSCRIDKDGEKGTFQSILLQDCTGRLLYPASTEIYKLWSEHSISVSWSKTSTVDGRVVGSESGGWSDSWSEEWSSPLSDADGRLTGPPGIWQQAGYSRAHLGIRQMGAYFNVEPADFTDCDLAVIAHVTRPEQNPVVTEAVPYLVASEAGGNPVVTETDRETIAARSAPAEGTHCVEALLSIEEKKSAFLAKLDDPTRLLSAALAAANNLGNATRAAGEANADLAAEEALLNNGQSVLDAWDQWFEQRLEQREQRRQEIYGSREPSWARGSRARAERRHAERTAELRQQVENQKQKVEQAQQVANAAAQAKQAAQASFDQALENFKQALADLRNAKDEFAELVVLHYRCSPCEVIAGHWATASRLKNLLDRLVAMLGQAQARVAAQLPQAQQRAAEAAGAAADAEDRLAELENRRSEIEQELRDAVDTSSGCLSLEPQDGWGWMNLASMDRTRGAIVSQGAIMVWRSSFKGVDVRVWVRPNCLREQIEDINWRHINELNRELADLLSELAEAESQAAEARRTAAIAQAAVDGLLAEQNALHELEQALLNSGIGENTDNVLNRLDELSSDCKEEMKDAVRGAADARRRQRNADRRTAAAEARERVARRRAQGAANELERTDPSDGDQDDDAAHDDLSGRAAELARDQDDQQPPVSPPVVEAPPPPGSVEEAEAQRRQAEQNADDAEETADRLEAEAEALENEVRELEREVSELAERLAAWRRYHRALAAYEDCLRRKQAALEELAALTAANASALQELANAIGQAADDLSEAADEAGELAAKLQQISNALDIIDQVLRRKDLTPAESLKAISDAFEAARELLPELPGVSEMLEFYNEAMKAIAGKLKEIEDIQVRRWSELLEAGVIDAEDVPPGLRDEIVKAARIRELMRIIGRNCGNPPVPPSGAVN